MKKNNKGFFLAETIVVISLITAVMAFVYPNLSKLYENYENRVKYYDQPEDLYLLKALYESGTVKIKDDCKYTTELTTNNSYNITIYTSKYNDRSKIYTNEGNEASKLVYNLKKYLNRMKITTNDDVSCRLIGVRTIGSTTTRYSSIKVNPNTIQVNIPNQDNE